MESVNQDLPLKKSMSTFDEIQCEEGHFPETTAQSLADIESPPLTEIKLVRSQSETITVKKIRVTDVSSLLKAKAEHRDMISIDLTCPELQVSFFGKPKTDQDLKKICDELRKFEFLKFLEINVGKNKITDDGIMHISSVLTKFDDLKGLELDFSGTEITDDGVYALFITLRTLRHLTHLALEFAWDQLTNTTAVSIGDMIKELKSLTRFKLSLFKTGITKAGVLEIASKLANLENLRKVDMWLNKSMQQECHKMIEAKIKQINPGCMVHIMWS